MFFSVTMWGFSMPHIPRPPLTLSHFPSLFLRHEHLKLETLQFVQSFLNLPMLHLLQVFLIGLAILPLIFLKVTCHVKLLFISIVICAAGKFWLAAVQILRSLWLQETGSPQNNLFSQWHSRATLVIVKIDRKIVFFDCYLSWIQ